MGNRREFQEKGFRHGMKILGEITRKEVPGEGDGLHYLVSPSEEIKAFQVIVVWLLPHLGRDIN